MLTVDVKIHVNILGRMSADLALVLALVATVHRSDLQTPVIRVLELHRVPWVSYVRLLTHCQQIYLFPIVLPTYPRHLSTQIISMLVLFQLILDQILGERVCYTFIFIDWKEYWMILILHDIFHHLDKWVTIFRFSVSDT